MSKNDRSVPRTEYECPADVKAEAMARAVAVEPLGALAGDKLATAAAAETRLGRALANHRCRFHRWRTISAA